MPLLHENLGWQACQGWGILNAHIRVCPSSVVKPQMVMGYSGLSDSTTCQSSETCNRIKVTPLMASHQLFTRNNTGLATFSNSGHCDVSRGSISSDDSSWYVVLHCTSPSSLWCFFFFFFLTFSSSPITSAQMINTVGAVTIQRLEAQPSSNRTACILLTKWAAC